MSLKNQYMLPLLVLLISIVFWIFIINKININTPVTSKIVEPTNPELSKVEARLFEKKSDDIVTPVEKQKEIIEKVETPVKLNKIVKSTPVTNMAPLEKTSNTASPPPKPQIKKEVVETPQIVKKEESKPAAVVSTFKPSKPAVSFSNLTPLAKSFDVSTQAKKGLKPLITKKEPVTNSQVDKIVNSMISKNAKQEVTPSKNTLIKEKSPTDITALQDKIKNLTNRLMKAEKKVSDQKVINKKVPNQSKNADYVKSLKTQDQVIPLPKQEKDKVDYFNRVIFDNNKTLGSLQNKVYQLSNDKKSSTYVKSIKAESLVRRNQIRLIELKKGESIWKIAVRAYGDGNQYIKILKANPQITVESARWLQPGIFIRVPL